MISLFTEKQIKEHKHKYFVEYCRNFFILTPEKHLFYRFSDGDLGIFPNRRCWPVERQVDIAAKYQLEYRDSQSRYISAKLHPQQVYSFLETAYTDSQYIFLKDDEEYTQKSLRDLGYYD